MLITELKELIARIESDVEADETKLLSALKAFCEEKTVEPETVETPVEAKPVAETVIDPVEAAPEVEPVATTDQAI